MDRTQLLAAACIGAAGVSLSGNTRAADKAPGCRRLAPWRCVVEALAEAFPCPGLRK